MNFLDKIILTIAPEAGLRRMRNRLAAEFVTRKYDAAVQGGRRNGGWWRAKTTAAEEVSKAAAELAATAQELCRNSPLAHRIKMIWASNMIGSGIRGQVATKNSNVRKKANQALSDWSWSRFADFEGHYSFYGLQWLWAATIVECGGVLIRKHVDADGGRANGVAPLRLQTFEQTMLDATVTTPRVDGHTVLSGIEFDKSGRPYGYWVKNLDRLTGQVSNDKSIFLLKDVECIHLFRKERAGQHLGVSWLAQSATTINKYDTLVDAKLMQDQIAACLGVIITGTNTAIGVNKDNNQLDEIEPGMVHYADAGSTVTTIVPPSSQGSTQFMETVRADIAIGAGLAHTQVTGDYSKLNFASGRMSKIEFFQTLDYCQKHMLEPALDTVFTWFKQVYTLSENINPRNILTCSWTYPPRGVVQPKEELDTLITKVRSGFVAPSAAVKSMGDGDLETVIEQWKVDKEIIGDLAFDIDPSLFSKAGNQLNVDDAASSNVNKKNDGEKDDE